MICYEIVKNKLRKCLSGLKGSPLKITLLFPTSVTFEREHRDLDRHLGQAEMTRSLFDSDEAGWTAVLVPRREPRLE